MFSSLCISDSELAFQLSDWFNMHALSAVIMLQSEGCRKSQRHHRKVTGLHLDNCRRGISLKYSDGLSVRTGVFASDDEQGVAAANIESTFGVR